jgi:DNA-binding FadR family transcriptional regulator
VLSGMTQQLSGDLVWSINKINAAMAAQRLAPQVSDALQQILTDMTVGHFERGDFSQQVMMWRVLADASDNRVLHMLVRCLFYYQIHSGVARLEQNQLLEAQSIFARTSRICRAVLSQKPIAAADAVSNLELTSRAR